MKKFLLAAAACLLLASPVLAQTAVAVSPVPSSTVGVTTVASPSAIVSIGTIAGDVLAWMAVLLGTPLAVFAIGLVKKLAGGVGYALADQQRDRLQELVENGIKWAAHEAQLELDGAIPVNVKSQLIAKVVNDYLPSHGRETVAALGGNVDNTAAMTQVVTARATDILNTPAPNAAPPA